MYTIYNTRCQLVFICTHYVYKQSDKSDINDVLY